MANNINPRYMTFSSKETDDLLKKVNNPDTTPTAESDELITSGAVAAALGNYSTTEQMNDALAGKMPVMGIAAEESVRSIVSDYNPDAVPEPEVEDGGE